MAVIDDAERLCDRVVDNAKDYKESIASGKAVVFFMASWCGPCRLLVQNYVGAETKAFLDEHQIHAFYVDVDRLSRIATAEKIVSIPNILAFEDGKRKGYQTGAIPPDAFERKLKEWYHL